MQKEPFPIVVRLIKLRREPSSSSGVLNLKKLANIYCISNKYLHIKVKTTKPSQTSKGVMSETKLFTSQHWAFNILLALSSICDILVMTLTQGSWFGDKLILKLGFIIDFLILLLNRITLFQVLFSNHDHHKPLISSLDNCGWSSIKQVKFISKESNQRIVP